MSSFDTAATDPCVRRPPATLAVFEIIKTCPAVEDGKDSTWRAFDSSDPSGGRARLRHFPARLDSTKAHLRASSHRDRSLKLLDQDDTIWREAGAELKELLLGSEDRVWVRKLRPSAFGAGEGRGA